MLCIHTLSVIHNMLCIHIHNMLCIHIHNMLCIHTLRVSCYATNSLFICHGIWRSLAYIYSMTLSHVWRDSFECVNMQVGELAKRKQIAFSVFCLRPDDESALRDSIQHAVGTCDMNHLYVRHVWHDSFVCVIWLIRTCDKWDMTHSCVWHDGFKGLTWLIHVRVWGCHVTPSHVTWLSHMRAKTWRFSTAWLYMTHLHVTWLICTVMWHIRTCDMIQPYESETSWVSTAWLCATFVCVTWLVYICDMTHSWMNWMDESCHIYVMLSNMSHVTYTWFQRLYVWHGLSIYMWHDSCIYVTLSYVCVCDMTRVYMWHDSCICVMWLIHMKVWHESGTWRVRAAWLYPTRICCLIHTCDMTCVYVWHGLFICVTWLIHMRDVPYSHVCRDSCLHVTWLVFACDMACLYVWHDLSIWETCRIHMCAVTHPYLWHDSFLCVTWLAYMCDMTYPYERRAVFTCVPWLIRTCDMTCDMTRSRRTTLSKTNFLTWHIWISHATRLNKTK